MFSLESYDLLFFFIVEIKIYDVFVFTEIQPMTFDRPSVHGAILAKVLLPISHLAMVFLIHLIKADKPKR